MAFEIYAPALDANNKNVTVEGIKVADCSHIEKETEICTASTPKASEVIIAPCSGFVVLWAEEGKDIEVGTPLATIYDNLEEAAESLEKKKRVATQEQIPVNATSKAIKLAQQHGIDLQRIKKEGIIKEKDVQDYIDAIKKEQ